MTKHFDEKMNERMTELSYALAERQILENTLTRRDMDRGKKRHQGKPCTMKKFRPPVGISSSFSTRKAAFLLKVSFSLKAGVVGNLTINLILALALLFC